MATVKSVFTYLMPAAGSSTSYSVDKMYEIYYLKPTGGAIVLAADIIISPTGTPILGSTFIFKYGGGVTIGAHQVTIFGINLTAAQALVESTIECFYDGSGWEIRLTRDSQSGVKDISGTDIVDGSIATAAIADSAITLAKQAPLAARGYLTRAGVAGALAGFNAVTGGQLVMGNGTDVVSQAVTGDVTISNTGVTTIGAGKITTAMLNFSLSTANLSALVTIPTASVLALNTTKYLLVPAVPGYAIKFKSGYCKVVFNSAAYATRLDVQIITDTATLYQAVNTNVLNANATRILNFTIDGFGSVAGSTQLITNKGLYAFTPTGNPVTGDSDIIIYVEYQLLPI